MKKIKISGKNISPSISLVIPIYNNAQTLVLQLKECDEVLEAICKTYEIIISNDKSIDDTRKLLTQFIENPHIKIFHQKNNIGIAKNILFLYKKAKYEHIILFSVDGDWNPEDIRRLIQKAIETKAHIVIGKRNIKEFSFQRKIVSIIYNFLPYLLFRVKTYDTGSIKVIRKDILKNITLKSKSVSFESEMLIKATKKGFLIDSIPISYKKHKTDRKSGVNIPLICNSFFDLIKLRIRGL